MPAMLSCIIAFILANPIMIFNRTDFLENSASRFEMPSADKIYQIIFKYSITWDMVNASGVNFLIISFAALVPILILALFREKYRNVAIAGVVSFVFLTLLFSVSRPFHGWYYWPIIFIVSLSIGGITVADWIVLLINLILMLPNIYFQIDTKLIQAEVVESYDDKIQTIIDEYIYKYEGCELIDYSCWQIPKNSSGEILWNYNIAESLNPQIIIISSEVLKYANENNQVRSIANSEGDKLIVVYEDEIFKIVFFNPNL
ncbi:MAG: hypothetical protein ACI4S2_02175 [Lachnospiraceae bacterium]